MANFIVKAKHNDSKRFKVSWQVDRWSVLLSILSNSDDLTCHITVQDIGPLF